MECKRGENKSREQHLQSIYRAQKGSRLAIKALTVHRYTFGPSHATGHQLGSVVEVMHGITLCVMLASVLKCTASSANPHFFRAHVGQAKILNTFNDVLGWIEHLAADVLTKSISLLLLPARVGEVDGVGDNQFTGSPRRL